jgi:uncharacterized RDD family membrane protein YckC
MHLPKPDFKPGAYSALGLERLSELEGLPLASFRRRAAAFSLDWLLAFSLWVLLLLLVIQVAHLDLGEKYVVSMNQGIGKWTFLPSALLYFALGTRLGHGRSPGKRLFKIRVVSLHHRELTLWTCVERFLGYGASMLEGGFGFAQYFLHPNRQTVHDRIAETIVIREAVVKEDTAAEIQDAPPSPGAPSRVQ